MFIHDAIPICQELISKGLLYTGASSLGYVIGTVAQAFAVPDDVESTLEQALTTINGLETSAKDLRLQLTAVRSELSSLSQCQVCSSANPCSNCPVSSTLTSLQQ